MPPFGLLHLIFFGVIIRRMMLSTEIRAKSNYYDFPTSNKIAIFSVLSLPTTETRSHQTPIFPTGTTPFKHDLLSSIRVHDLVKWISNVTVQKHFIPCRPFDPDSTSSSFITRFTLSLSVFPSYALLLTPPKLIIHVPLSTFPCISGGQ